MENFVEVSNPAIYTGLPEDWHVVVTDVKDSTAAIEKGGYKVVNLLGASSIIAMLNLTKSFSLPFVFGGDGAAICLPPSLVDRAKRSLVATTAPITCLIFYDGVHVHLVDSDNRGYAVPSIPMKEI